MANTMRPPSFRTSREDKLLNIQANYQTSTAIIDDGSLCGIYMTKFKARIVREVLFAAALSACSVETTVKMRDSVIAETTETDLQAAIDNVIQPLQGAAALESRVESVPSYWYNENAAIVCQVGGLLHQDNCQKLTLRGTHVRKHD